MRAVIYKSDGTRKTIEIVNEVLQIDDKVYITYTDVMAMVYETYVVKMMDFSSIALYND